MPSLKQGIRARHPHRDAADLPASPTTAALEVDPGDGEFSPKVRAVTGEPS
jgi:hypothetical protein